MTHRASRGGVAPASPKVSAASFSAALSLLISSLFFKFAPPQSEANGEVEGGACQRLLDRCLRNLVSFLFLVPIPGFSQKIPRQEAAGATIASSLDPQHPGFCELHFMRAAC